MLLIIGIGIVVYWFVKTTKEKIEEVYKTPIEKRLLNTLEQRALAREEK
jgi:hypothetical protein